MKKINPMRYKNGDSL